MTRRHRDPATVIATTVVAVLLLAWSVVVAPAPAGAEPSPPAPPSAVCHATDGAFTACPGGAAEWSDVPVRPFPETNSYLYADQADLDPARAIPGSPVDTFVLMYDECSRTTPLGADEYFLVSFDTVEVEDGKEKLEKYVIYVFSDGTIIFFEDGVLQRNPEGRYRVPEIDGQRGAAGFGPSPTCPADHLVVEYEIILDAAGGFSYSPDPQFWGASPPECTVNVTGGAPAMDVGKRAQFSAAVSGGGTPVTYQWSIAGEVIKDYSETTNAPWSTMAMTAADLQGQMVDFYWKPLANQVHPNNAGPQPRDVTVNVKAGDSECSDTETINVERNNTDITRQAEDAYTSNHGGAVLTEHSAWHVRFPFFNASQGGALFFDFHNQYISRFNSWRSEFGYPQVGVFDPVGALPTGVDVDHAARNSNTVNNPKPSWFTIAGGAATRGANGLPCDTGGDQTMLADFPANRNLLGCATESPWHNETHVQIGSDMGGTGTAPRDPIFWRWHNFVDVIGEERKTLTPPTVEYQSPFRLYRYITEIPSVSVTFSEPVTGVAAGDLQVNGSAATAVSGAGDGPYLFTGFAPPPVGPVTVTVGPGAIVDLAGEAFEGAFWEHVLVDPAADSDGDGVSDGAEAGTFQTDPTTADTDGDGLPDGFETGNTCLDPLEDQAGPAEPGAPPPDDDADDDGRTDLEEFTLGTDPCSPTSRNIIGNGTVLLGVNDEGHLNVRGGPPSASGTTTVGLRYVPTGAESIAPGCLCEGWGVADAISGVAGYANVSTDGVQNVTPVSFTSTASSAVSVTEVGGTFRVTHDYHPSSTPNLYEATVTVENIGAASTDLRYRRVMDWDVEPTPFDEFVTVVTVQGTERAANVLFSSDDGFASANPLSGPSSIDFVGDAVDSGPNDHGALFDFGFGALGPGETASFNIYYGAAGSEDEAEEALTAVRSEVYSFGQPNTPDGPTLGQPNTFIFAFNKVGGAPVFPRDSDGDGTLDELDNCVGIANVGQADSNLNGVGDACERPDREHSTAGFLHARLDATTTAEPTSVRFADEPGTVERLTRIVEFRIEAGLASSAADLVANLVDSLVNTGLVAPGQAEELEQEVLAGMNQPPDCSGVRVAPTVLRHTDHRMVGVSVTGGVDPDLGDAVTLVIDAITQDEATSGLGSGDQAPDGALTSPPSSSASIRAERGESGDGRVYRLHVTGTDRGGATCEAVVPVSVPRFRTRPAVDSVAHSFDSLRP